MRVFSACVKMMKRHKGAFFIYFGVFSVVLISMTFMSDTSMYGDFSPKKPSYALINRDTDGALAQGFEEILKNQGTLTELEDSREAMMDAGFFQAVDGIFIIPDGFEEAFWNGGEKNLGIWQRPSTASGYYLRSVAEQYLSTVRMYRDAGSSMTQKEIADAAVSSLKKETQVTLRRYLSSAVISERIKLYLRFMPYVLLLMCISFVNIVFLNFKKPEIRMRNFCSPKPPSSMALQKLLYAFTVGLVSWLLLNLIGAAACNKEWAGVDWRFPAMLILNSFVMLLVAVSVALLSSSFIESENTQSFVSNILALVICFLSGVFVPVEMLSSGILRISKFVPVYWYEDNVSKICGLTSFDAGELTSIWQGMAIQLGFAVALFCIYLLVNKYKERAAESFGSIRTEIEM